MSVIARGEYRFEPADLQKNFHGNQLVYLKWFKHLSILPLAFPFPPDMPFGAIVAEILPQFYGMHPDWAKVDVSALKWTLDGTPFEPDPAKGLAEQGILHKSFLSFETPGLTEPETLRS